MDGQPMGQASMLWERIQATFRRLLSMGPPQFHSPNEGDFICIQDGKQLSLLKTFPSIFTVACCLVFMVPAWLQLSVARNQATSYFSSSWTYIVFIIPIVIAVTHCVNTRLQAPNKYVVIVTLVLPSFILLLCASVSYVSAVDKYEKLFSLDCDAFSQKRSLQQSWEAAYNLYMGCLEETGKASNFTVPQLMEKFRITDCEEYQGAYSGYSIIGKKRPHSDVHQKEWEYLEYLEHNHYCSGWCYPGVQLWSSKAYKDSCSVAVSHLYRSYVAPHSAQVVIVAIMALGASVVALFALGSILRSNCIDW